MARCINISYLRDKVCKDDISIFLPTTSHVLTNEVSFEAISSLLVTEHSNSRQDVTTKNNIQKISLIFKNAVNKQGTSVLNTAETKELTNIDLLVRNIVLSYLAANKKYNRSGLRTHKRYEKDPHDSPEIKFCEANCLKRIVNICMIGNYMCTDYTVSYLAHSCYSECNYHLEDPNPYREHLYKEKFRKETTTTPPPLDHPTFKKKDVEDETIFK